MRRLQMLTLVLMFVALAPGNSAAAGVPRHTVAILRAMRIQGLPSSWAGIWADEFTVRDCVSHNVIVTGTQLDTLCAGAAFQGSDDAGNTFSCSGTWDDTQLNLTCTGTDVSEYCVSTYIEHLVGVRTGETATMTWDYTIQNVSEGCTIPVGACTEITDHMTRIGSSAQACVPNPVRQASWGSLKLLYR